MLQLKRVKSPCLDFNFFSLRLDALLTDPSCCAALHRTVPRRNRAKGGITLGMSFVGYIARAAFVGSPSNRAVLVGWGAVLMG